MKSIRMAGDDWVQVRGDASSAIAAMMAAQYCTLDYKAKNRAGR